MYEFLCTVARISVFIGLIRAMEPTVSFARLMYQLETVGPPRDSVYEIDPARLLFRRPESWRGRQKGVSRHRKICG
jgi:hypothetical protein